MVVDRWQQRVEARGVGNVAHDGVYDDETRKAASIGCPLHPHGERATRIVCQRHHHLLN